MPCIVICRDTIMYESFKDADYVRFKKYLFENEQD